MRIILKDRSTGQIVGLNLVALEHQLLITLRDGSPIGNIIVESMKDPDTDQVTKNFYLSFTPIESEFVNVSYGGDNVAGVIIK